MENLVERFYQPLYRFALSLAKSEATASDLTQETFYLWAAKGHQLRDHSKVKSWLFTTLHREFLSQCRHATRFPHHEASEVEAELPTVPSDVVNKIDGGLVMEALQSVDDSYRATLTLFYVDDLTYKEIAEVLNLPVGTVMSRLSRGKAQLREKLGALIVTRESDVIPFKQSAT